MFKDLTREQLIVLLQEAQAKAIPQVAAKVVCKPCSFDWSATRGRKVALKISYLGHKYYGFTGLMEGTVPTIEGELFKALTICKMIPGVDLCGWSKAGRTDKGVSGFGQVVSLWIKTKLPAGHPSTLDWDAIKGLNNELYGDHEILDHDSTVDEYDYLSLINRLLPPEIRILAWTPVAQTFDARFSCKWRKYKYFFPVRGLDIPKMKIAARNFIGTSDCRFICKLDPSKIHTKNFFIRDIYDVSVVDINKDFCALEVKGKAFLWHQVRYMMALMYLVGKGLEEPAIITTILDPAQHPPDSGKPIFSMAPDGPLVLVECGYDGLRWIVRGSTQSYNPERVISIVDNLWSEASLYTLQLETLKSEYLALGVDKLGPLPPRGPKHVPVMKRKRANSVNELLSKVGMKETTKKSKFVGRL